MIFPGEWKDPTDEISKKNTADMMILPIKTVRC
jgi:hypothetical protein